MNALVAELERRVAAVDAASQKAISGFAAVASSMTVPWLALGDRIKTARDEAMTAAAEVRKLEADESSSAEQLAAARSKVEEIQRTLLGLLREQTGAAGTARQSLQDLGVQAVAAFGAALMSGKTYNEAMVAVGPSLVLLGDSYKALGLEVDDVGLKNLMLAAQVAQTNPQLIAGVDGLATSMNGLAQLGLLNVDTFGAMQRTGAEMHTRLQSQFAGTENGSRLALAPMQGYLQEASKWAAELGIPLDANTQELIDQSKELWLWKEAAKSNTDRVLEGMEQLVNKVSELVEKILGVAGAINAIPSSKTITFQAAYYDPGPPDGFGDTTRGGGGDGGDDGFASGTFGRLGRWFGSFPKAGFATALHGIEAVITPGQAVPFAMDVLAGGAGGSTRAMDLSGMTDEVRGLRGDLVRQQAMLPTLIDLALKNQPGRRRG
jgi:hypothetical protein